MSPHTPLPPASATPRRRAWRGYRLLAVALALSVLVHFAFSLWPHELRNGVVEAPLAVSLTAMPPPPLPTPAVPPPPKPQARVAKRSPLVAPTPDIDVAPVATAAPAAPDVATPPADPVAAPAMEDTVVAAASVADGKVMPPRVDLVYKLYLGTHGFLIGDATYRFEHADNRYRITTVGKARGLAALLVRGEGRLESEGRITSEGLQPTLFRFERSDTGKREQTIFNWDTGTVTLNNDKTVSIETPMFDALSLMWQYYFTPPGSARIAFSLATTRRVTRYSVTHEGDETIQWGKGSIATERWHRVSDDGQNNSYAWLAPSLRHLPVKMRLTNNRGSVDIVLDAIRVDASAKASADVWAPNIEGATDDAFEAPVKPLEAPPPTEFAPGATFPTNTGA